MQNSKYSCQRENIIKVLKSTKSHPTADWIYDKVREEIPNISLGTVYRNLSRLSSEGEVQKISLGVGGDHFDGDISSHAHFVCNKCGKIADIYTDYSNLLKTDAEAKIGASVNSCSVILYGLCSECGRKISNKSK
jgi:Fur family peroxide stress response transcriptional regulator